MHDDIERCKTWRENNFPIFVNFQDSFHVCVFLDKLRTARIHVSCSHISPSHPKGTDRNSPLGQLNKKLVMPYLLPAHTLTFQHLTIELKNHLVFIKQSLYKYHTSMILISQL